MKKTLAALLALILVLVSFSGCRQLNTSDKVDDILGDLEYDYSDYLDDHDKEPPKSVLDQLDLMLDHYVSGLSTPAPSSIPSVVLDPDDEDSQNIISSTNTTVSDEAGLEALILQAMKNIDTEISFKVNGSWLDDELLYDIIFERVHDVYMIDAFGLHAYTEYVTNDGTNDVYELRFDYIDDKSPDEIRDLRTRIDSKAKQIVSSLNLGGKSDFEIVTAIDQYLCDTVYYPDEPFITHDYTPYGTMFDGRAVCEGYARTTKILCDLCGVDCYFVTGYCGNDPVNGGHAWNLVSIDGKWYQLDTTWNDGGSNKDYFLVTDDFMSLSRVWDRSRYPASEQSAYSN